MVDQQCSKACLTPGSCSLGSSGSLGSSLLSRSRSLRKAFGPGGAGGEVGGDHSICGCALGEPAGLQANRGGPPLVPSRFGMPPGHKLKGFRPHKHHQLQLRNSTAACLAGSLDGGRHVGGGCLVRRRPLTGGPAGRWRLGTSRVVDLWHHLRAQRRVARGQLDRWGAEQTEDKYSRGAEGSAAGASQCMQQHTSWEAQHNEGSNKMQNRPTCCSPRPEVSADISEAPPTAWVRAAGREGDAGERKVLTGPSRT